MGSTLQGELASATCTASLSSRHNTACGDYKKNIYDHATALICIPLLYVITRMYKQQALLKVTGIQYSPQAVEWQIQMHQFCTVLMNK